MAWTQHPLASFAALIVGVGLLVWIAIQITIIGYSNEPPLQGFNLVVGATITIVALRWLGDVGVPGLHGRAA